ncbi:MAG: hydrogenase maturation protease [Acidobacteria bacterium]|nr:hydrogenase maturation protease [Acidobacteriota bacterium]
MMERARAPLLVLGLGNPLLRDDGVGLRVLAEVERAAACGDGSVEFIDGGTQGLALLGLLADRHALVILDALRLGAAPGTVHVLRGQRALDAAPGRGLSAHEGNAGDLLRAAALTGDLPANVAVIGVEPELIETRIGLTTSVEQAVAKAAAIAVACIGERAGGPNTERV